MNTTAAATARVLVVDDDQAIREIVATRLRSLGYDVSTAGNGSSALDRVKRDSFDVILLDILMPDIDGHEVLDSLQALGHTPSVIFLTALGELDDRLRGLYEGAVDYITKPFEPDELAARVAVAARTRQEVDSARAEMYTDSLTGLANRAAFEKALSREIARSVRHGHTCALVVLDADRLKEVNDTFGHGAGDKLLQAIGRAMSGVCRETDHAARVGGDEFAIILPETDGSRAERFLDRLRKRLASEHFDYDGFAGTPACSIGVAIFPLQADGKDSLKQAADVDLYRSKRQGPR